MGRSVDYLPTHLQYDGLKAALRNDAENPPPNQDIRITAHSEGLLTSLETDDVVISAFQKIIQDRNRFATPTYLKNLALRGLQKQLISPRSGDSLYPLAADVPGYWTEQYAVRLRNNKFATEFWFDLYTREVQSNISERYKSHKLLSLLFRERLGNNPTFLDVGCSQNLGLKKLSLGWRFDDVEVRDMDTGRHESGFEQTIGSMLTRTLLIGDSVGTDMYRADDPGVARWAKSCSFYPSELLDADKVRTYDSLVETHDIQNVTFMLANFASKRPNVFPENPKRKFDIVSLSTVLYQLTEPQRRNMLNNARRYVRKGGFILVQDGVVKILQSKDEDLSEELYFPEDGFSKPYLYRTYIYDTDNHKKRFQELFRWSNGRCTKLQLSEYAKELINELPANKVE